MRPLAEVGRALFMIVVLWAEAAIGGFGLARVPVILEGGNKRRRITYTDILGMLEPLNEGRDRRHVITYNSLWIHAKRHSDLAGTAAYWRARKDKELRNALGGITGCGTY
jgi:hypothetical protein